MYMSLLRICLCMRMCIYVYVHVHGRVCVCSWLFRAIQQDGAVKGSVSNMVHWIIIKFCPTCNTSERMQECQCYEQPRPVPAAGGAGHRHRRWSRWWVWHDNEYSPLNRQYTKWLFYHWGNTQVSFTPKHIFNSIIWSFCFSWDGIPFVACTCLWPSVTFKLNDNERVI